MTESRNNLERSGEDAALRAAAITRIVEQLPAIELLGSARVPVSPYDWGGQLALAHTEPVEAVLRPRPGGSAA
jgi:hypothetical protein